MAEQELAFGSFQYPESMGKESPCNLRQPFLGNRECLLSLAEEERDHSSAESSLGQGLHYDLKSHTA